MKVSRNFETLYKTEQDPWNIGDARSNRYDFYFNKIIEGSRSRHSILDIGCGIGAFLARFKDEFSQLNGVELSREAIKKGESKYSFIRFHEASADNLQSTPLESQQFDTIIFSDVIYYFNETSKNNSLKWIADHLAPDGLAFIAAWCPGAKYLEHDELKRLIERYFAIEFEESINSQHGVFLARRKKHFIAITIDYETWHPIPKNKSIDWQKDIFEPTQRLLEIFNRQQVPMTIMAEMGEYFWLKENMPHLSQAMEEQWKQLVKDGHDIQLHLHPNWLPELGAHYQNGHWTWDWSKSKAADFPGSLSELIEKCKITLESILGPVDPNYQVTSFRAGAYQAQPFKPLYDALVANNIFCDSSVYSGGYSEDRGYDYTLAYSRHQPYFANAYDPQLKAPPAEQGIVEIPIFTYKPNQRWFMDDAEGNSFASRLINYLKNHDQDSTELYRIKKRLKKIARICYFRSKPLIRWIHPLIPKSWMYLFAPYGPETLASNQYFVLIGHTKSELHYDALEQNIKQLASDPRFEPVTLSAMAIQARRELSSVARGSAREEADYQSQREYEAIMGEERNERQSHYLQGKIPLDRQHILDLGCGAGYWSNRISQLLPRSKVIGIDWSQEFISKAQNEYSSDQVSFQTGDFSNLPFSDNLFDCVYADNTLEHSYDITQTLKETYRVLNEGGILLAAVPSDARCSAQICDNHTWKTYPHEVRMRLEVAGFKNIEICEIDTFLEFKMPPYPPSQDKMMYIKACKTIAEQ